MPRKSARFHPTDIRTDRKAEAFPQQTRRGLVVGTNSAEKGPVFAPIENAGSADRRPAAETEPRFDRLDAKLASGGPLGALASTFITGTGFGFRRGSPRTTSRWSKWSSADRPLRPSAPDVHSDRRPKPPRGPLLPRLQKREKIG